MIGPRHGTLYARIEAGGARRLLALTLIALVPLRTARSQRQIRVIQVRSCPAADSVLGPSGDDLQGLVRGWYAADRDSTRLANGIVSGPSGVGIGMHFAGRTTAHPEAQVLLFLPADHADSTLYPGESPVVKIILDDSLHLVLEPTQVAQYPKSSSVIPISAFASADVLLAAARAQRVAFAIGSNVLVLTPVGRRDMRALYRVAMCGVMEGR